MPKYFLPAEYSHSQFHSRRIPSAENGKYLDVRLSLQDTVEFHVKGRASGTKS